MEKDNPLVSIIIVNLNGRPFLDDCLNSLGKVIYTRFEIILVDNNSVDDSVEFVKQNYPSTILIQLDKNYGFAYPNNIGAKNAKGEFLLFLNNDTKVDSKFIAELVDVMKIDHQVGICQSLLMTPNEEVDSSGDFIDELGVAYSSKEKIEQIREALSAKGAAMMIRKDLFNKLDGFDEKFFASFEDVDLGWRCWIMSYKVVVVPKSIVYHIGGQTVCKMKNELAFHGYKNQLSMKITNFERRLVLKSLILFFIIYGFKTIRVFLDYKLRGKTEIRATSHENKIAQKPNLVAFFKGLFWLCANLQYLKFKHKKVNSKRVYSTKELQSMNVIR